MSHLLSLHEKTKSVLHFGRICVEKEKCSRKNIVAHIWFEMGEVEKNVKLRIFRMHSVASFGNPNLLIVEFRWKLIFLKLGFSDWHLLNLFSFFRLASIFFFPIGIWLSCFLFSGLLSKLETDCWGWDQPLTMSEISLPENLIIEDISEHQAKLVFFWDLPIEKPMHCCRCLESQDHHQNRMFVSLLVTN